MTVLGVLCILSPAMSCWLQLGRLDDEAQAEFLRGLTLAQMHTIQGLVVSGIVLVTAAQLVPRTYWP